MTTKPQHLINRSKFEFYTKLRKEIIKNLEKIKIDIYRDERLFYFCDQLAYRVANLLCEKLNIEITDLSVLNEIIKMPYDLVTFITTKDYRDTLYYDYTSTTFTKHK